MRAQQRAIQKISINKTDFSVRYFHYGDKMPRGSAVRAILTYSASMLEAGIIDKGW